MPRSAHKNAAPISATYPDSQGTIEKSEKGSCALDGFRLLRCLLLAARSSAGTLPPEPLKCADPFF
jgi:hypothetical protein